MLDLHGILAFPETRSALPITREGTVMAMSGG
ncbi:hypothetical protein Snas_2480 [Stackebrandtia nassauensis DSM 44728]|uniref:Uncharacterized protein n=1 Tax=Stackebrandtia nassauensis (strain DSM 44728 / CIP 108903 / NRRL B-16338 / NBRC 102104 / LLR-40K-21) TaxID=446470 RepID=D3Q4Y3_STANL|nr:hypothetical protein Snas_2480 [Stackebrandtia nassauensis DSM 44728]